MNDYSDSANQNPEKLISIGALIEDENEFDDHYLIDDQQNVEIKLTKEQEETLRLARESGLKTTFAAKGFVIEEPITKPNWFDDIIARNESVNNSLFEDEVHEYIYGTNLELLNRSINSRSNEYLGPNLGAVLGNRDNGYYHSIYNNEIGSDNYHEANMGRASFIGTSVIYQYPALSETQGQPDLNPTIIYDEITTYHQGVEIYTNLKLSNSVDLLNPDNINIIGYIGNYEQITWQLAICNSLKQRKIHDDTEYSFVDKPYEFGYRGQPSLSVELDYSPSLGIYTEFALVPNTNTTFFATREKLNITPRLYMAHSFYLYKESEPVHIENYELVVHQETNNEPKPFYFSLCELTSALIGYSKAYGNNLVLSNENNLDESYKHYFYYSKYQKTAQDQLYLSVDKNYDIDCPVYPAPSEPQKPKAKPKIKLYLPYFIPRLKNFELPPKIVANYKFPINPVFVLDKNSIPLMPVSEREAKAIVRAKLGTIQDKNVLVLKLAIGDALPNISTVHSILEHCFDLPHRPHVMWMSVHIGNYILFKYHLDKAVIFSEHILVPNEIRKNASLAKEQFGFSDGEFPFRVEIDPYLNGISSMNDCYAEDCQVKDFYLTKEPLNKASLSNMFMLPKSLPKSKQDAPQFNIEIPYYQSDDYHESLSYQQDTVYEDEDEDDDLSEDTFYMDLFEAYAHEISQKINIMRKLLPISYVEVDGLKIDYTKVIP